MAPNKKELVKRQFSRRGHAYLGGVFTDENVLERILKFAAPKKEDTVLDVATGGGFLAFKFAEATRAVVGIDLTKEMLEQAQQLRETKDLSNVAFGRGDIEALPFANERFDLVTCRYSFHHFPHPELALDEMKRVCKRRGRVLIIDGTAPKNEEKSSFLNRIESLRDPSHVRLYSFTEFHKLFDTSAMPLVKEDSYSIDFYLDEWLDMADPDEKTKTEVSMMMKSCLKRNRCGLNVRLHEGRIRFSYTIGMFLGVKE